MFVYNRGAWLPAIHPMPAEPCDASRFFFCFLLCLVCVSSVQSLYRLGHRRDTKDDSAEILFQSFLRQALVSSSGMGRDVRSLILSIQHFLCRPRLRPPSKVPRRMILERLSWRTARPNHASFRLLTVARRDSCGLTRKLIFRNLTVARRDSCGLTRKLIMLRTQSLVSRCVYFALLILSRPFGVKVSKDEVRIYIYDLLLDTAIHPIDSEGQAREKATVLKC